MWQKLLKQVARIPGIDCPPFCQSRLGTVRLCLRDGLVE